MVGGGQPRSTDTPHPFGLLASGWTADRRRSICGSADLSRVCGDQGRGIEETGDDMWNIELQTTGRLHVVRAIGRGQNDDEQPTKADDRANDILPTALRR